MGVYYDIYLEGLFGTEWRALGPWFKGREGGYCLGAVMGGQSHVRAMLDTLDCGWDAPGDVSPEVREKLLFGDGEGCGPGREDGGQHLAESLWFPMSRLDGVDPARFEYEAYVVRSEMRAFELGEVDEICDWLTPEEYGNLPADEKRAYTFYRWNDPWGTYRAKCELKSRCEAVCDMHGGCYVDGRYPGRPQALRCIVRIG